MKLSTRAQQLLCLVERQSRNGHMFVPHRFMGYHTDEYLFGGGDANCFKSLERKGLIEPYPRLGEYSYTTSEEGRRLAETLAGYWYYLSSHGWYRRGDEHWNKLHERNSSGNVVCEPRLGGHPLS